MYATQRRFFEKVLKGTDFECWTWVGGVSHGYGCFKFNGRPVGAHQFSFLNFYGYMPKLIRHKCDNPKCVNPNHLEAGTHTLNVADRVSRGRSATGVRNGRSKLTPFEVCWIKQDRTTSSPDVAKIMDVDPKVIRDIRNGVTWKGVVDADVSMY